MSAGGFLSLFVVICIWTGVEIFAARVLMARETPLSELILFSLIQGVIISIAWLLIQADSINFLLIIMANLLTQRWLLEDRIFPYALFGAIGPILFFLLGEILFPPFFVGLFGTTSNLATLWGTIDRPFLWTSMIPLVLLATFKLFRNKQGLCTKKEGGLFSPELIWQFTFFFPVIILHKVLLILFFKYGISELYFGQQFFYSGFIILPVFFVTLLRYTQELEAKHKVIQHHAQINRLQKMALRTLREERHDFLNELTLISTYLEMGRIEEAASCIAYAAANLSDRYNYTATLPGDAWLTILDFKQKEAEKRRISFHVEIKAEQPEDFNECRLLPKFIVNLVDNAFYAAAQAPVPLVHLVWREERDGARILEIANNGPQIPLHISSKIFVGGVTAKEDNDSNHGWGLVICKKIATELGGTLTYKSDPKRTVFTLTLPPASTKKAQASSLST